MIRLDSEIVLSGQVFTFSHEVSIDSSYDNLLDSGKIIIPKRIRYVNQQGESVPNITQGANALFKAGDPVEISAGYNTNITKFFTGYIKGVRTKFPLLFEVEDEVYKLKQNRLNLTLKNPQLSELLKKIIPEGVEYEVTAEQNLGNFRIKNASTAAVLDELRTKHGIYSFFRDGILYVGLAVNPKLQKTHRFEFNTTNLISGESLTFVDESERKIRVVCKSIDNNNKTLEAEAGDIDGETRTLYFNNYSLKDLQSTADRIKNQLKYSGYEGSFLTFIDPIVNHGDVVELVNRTIPEQSGAYLVTRVVTRFGFNVGGRQEIYIKQKIYDLVEDANGNLVKANESEFYQKALGE